MIGIGNDHAAIELKLAVCEHLKEKGIEFIDYGIAPGEKIDYPDAAEMVCRDVVFTPQGDIEVQDIDELDGAYESGDITKEQYVAAFKEGLAILSELCTDIPKTEKLFCDILAHTLQLIEQGAQPVNTKYQIERGTLK